MIDQKTIRKQRMLVAFFFVSLGLFFLCAFLFSQVPFKEILGMIEVNSCTGCPDPDVIDADDERAISSDTETAAPSGDESMVSPENGFTSSRFYTIYKKILADQFILIAVLCLAFFICSIVLAISLPKAFSTLRKAKLQRTQIETGDEMPVMPEDLEGHTLRPGENGWTQIPQDEITKDLSSLFETTARIYDGKETTEGIPGGGEDTGNSEEFCFLEDLYFLGSDERIY